ncbi:MAG: hypothetical protein LBJ77_01280 [Holosporales bacterium]|jgi:GTP cyclohydrolase II|nr:hypothetical protein [Holosporales bacterium]
MKKIFVWFWCCCVVACGSDIPPEYPIVKERLVVFKDDNLKVYHGGPVVNKDWGVRWIMPVVFENDQFEPRSVYEVSFINCTPDDAAGAKVYFLDVNDVDLKFNNQSNDDSRIFTLLLSGNHEGSHKYVVIRKTDVSMVTFPDVYVEELTTKQDASNTDKELNKILSYLETKYQVQPQFTYISTSNSVKPGFRTLSEFLNSSRQVQGQQIIFAPPVKVLSKIKDRLCPLYITKVFILEDHWKVYYVIGKDSDLSVVRNRKIFVRVDSGCVNGQIYGDDSCDCADQLFDFISKYVADGEGIVLHIPCHDGRGFGFAPKAETEIYKQGGTGRIHTTGPIDTISAAKLLYKANDQNYDIRNYEGVALILKALGCNDISLVTDSHKKVDALAGAGIKVERVPTETHKLTCRQHLDAKKNNPLFFG